MFNILSFYGFFCSHTALRLQIKELLNRLKNGVHHDERGLSSDEDVNLSRFFHVVQSDIAVPHQVYRNFFEENRILYKQNLLVMDLQNVSRPYCKYGEYVRPVEDESLEQQSDESNHRILIGVDVKEIVEKLLQAKRDMEEQQMVVGGVIVSVSQDLELLRFIEQHDLVKDRYRVKIIVVDAPGQDVKERLLRRGFLQNVEQVDKVVEKGFYLMGQIRMHRLRDIIDIYNNSTAEEGARKLFEALVVQRFTRKEEIEKFYQTRKDSLEYLDNVNVAGIMEHMLSRLLIELPSDPMEYLIHILKEMKLSKSPDTEPKKVCRPFSNEALARFIQI